MKLLSFKFVWFPYFLQKRESKDGAGTGFPTCGLTDLMTLSNKVKFDKITIRLMKSTSTYVGALCVLGKVVNDLSPVALLLLLLF